MPKELLLEMLSRKLFPELAVIGLLYLTGWLLSFALGLKILCLRPRLRIVLLPALFMALYSLFGPQLMTPFSFHALAPLGVILLISRITPGFQIFQVTWVGLMAYISQALGPAFLNTLPFLAPQTTAFFQNPWGRMALIGASAAGPGVLLLALRGYSYLSLKGYLGQGKIPHQVDLRLPVIPLLITFGCLAGLNLSTFGSSDGLQTGLALMISIGILTAAYLYYLQRIRDKAILAAVNEITPRGCAMKVLRRMILDDRERFRRTDEALPEFEDIFAGLGMAEKDKNYIINGMALTVGNTIRPGFIERFVMPFQKLSPTELEVMMMLAQGESNKKIAYTCHMEEAEVEALIARLLQKFRTESEADLAALIDFMDGVLAKRGEVNQGEG